MRHYVAVQDENGRWFYANEGRHRQTGEHGWSPSGACTARPLKTCPKCNGGKFANAAFKDCDCSYGLVDDPDTAPCPGHDTAAEAYEHERQRRLDKNLQFFDDREDAKQLHRCEAPGCKAYTSGLAEVGPYRHWHLCSEHRTREVVDPLFFLGESWES